MWETLTNVNDHSIHEIRNDSNLFQQFNGDVYQYQLFGSHRHLVDFDLYCYSDIT